MKFSKIMAAPTAFTLVFALSGCSAPAILSDWTVPPPVAPKLVGSINSTNGSSLRGAGAITPTTSSGWMHAIVSISGGEEGTQYPWRINYGSCNQTTQSVGQPNIYPPIVPSADGNANVEVALPFKLDLKQRYSITVQESPSDPDHTIACGELGVTK